MGKLLQKVVEEIGFLDLVLKKKSQELYSWLKLKYKSLDLVVGFVLEDEARFVLFLKESLNCRLYYTRDSLD